MDEPRWTDEAKDQVATLLRQGLSASHIAAQFRNTSRNSIIGLVHRYKQLREVGFARSLRCSNPKTTNTVKPPPRVVELVKPPRKKPVHRQHKPRLPRPANPTEPCHIPMLAITAGQCRYPMWDGNGAPDFMMCGAATRRSTRAIAQDMHRECFR